MLALRTVLYPIAFAATARQLYPEGQPTRHVRRQQSVEGELVVPGVHPFPPQTPTYIVALLGCVACLPCPDRRRRGRSIALLCWAGIVRRLSGEVRDIPLNIHNDFSAVWFDKEWMVREWRPKEGISHGHTSLADTEDRWCVGETHYVGHLVQCDGNNPVGSVEVFRSPHADVCFPTAFQHH